jgi:hypothetical protein
MSFYSLFQYVSDPLREEPVNVGVALLCPEARFSDARFLNKSQLKTALRRALSASPLNRAHALALMETTCAWYKDSLPTDTTPLYMALTRLSGSDLLQ